MAVGRDGRAIAAGNRAARGRRAVCRRVSARAARRGVAPGDPRVQRALAAATVPLNMNEPVGADVYFKDYTDVDGPWLLVGRVPIKDVRVPLGELRWRLVKDGFDTAEGASPVGPVITLRPNRRGAARNGLRARRTVERRGRRRSSCRTSGWTSTKSRIANSSDSSMPAAIATGNTGRSRSTSSSGLRDRTGRPGPATWELGTFPEGQADYPVSGVSWYEAAAYAEFAGKRLPTVFHWRQATGNVLFGHAVASVANFNGKSAEPVTQLKDLGAYGTYGLAGNVKEWIWNATGDRRNVVGGAWNDPPYMAVNREARLPLDRHETHGFRCVRDVSPLPADALAAIPPRSVGRSDKPVGDDLYAAYKALYAYDRSPLDPQVETCRRDGALARRTRLDRGGVRTRARAHLSSSAEECRPAVSARRLVSRRYAFGLLPLGRDLAGAPGASSLHFLPRAGRALVFPVYQGMFQRSGGVGEFPRDDQMNAYRDMVVQWSKDLGRTIDYLETRPDIDAGKVGYYGISAGANAALPIVAVEPRLKAVVLLSGGLPAVSTPAGGGSDQFRAAHHGAHADAERPR